MMDVSAIAEKTADVIATGTTGGFFECFKWLFWTAVGCVLLPW